MAIPAPAPRVRAVELGALAALVVLADGTLWSGAGGLGVGLLLALAPAVLLAASPARRHSVRLVGIAAALLCVALRSAWDESGWTSFVGLLLVFSFVVALRTRRSFAPEIGLSALVSGFAAFPALGRYGRGAVRLVTPARLRDVRWARVLVPVGVVGMFAILFTFANPLLERWAARLVELLGSGASASPERLLFWTACALLSAGLLAPAIREPRLSERLGPGHRLDPSTLAAPEDGTIVMARNVLVGVNLLFLGYNALDAVYLWAGTPPPGLSFTGYAHRGTVWLTVSLAVATVVFGLLFRGPMAVASDRTRLVRRLAYVWAVQNLVLAAGTFRRITMYVDDSGLTMLRALGIAGVVLVAAAFGLIVLKVARRHTALWLLRRQLDALALALVVWTVLPVDAMVWSFNVARIQAGEDRPLLHLFGQTVSAEAVPELLPLLAHPDPQIARGVAVELVRIRQPMVDYVRRNRSWAARDLAVPRAVAALERVRPRIRALGAEGTAVQPSSLRERAYRANGVDPRYGLDWRF